MSDSKGRWQARLRQRGESARLRVLAAFALLLALHSVPIFSTVLPPLVDYPNHLARLHLIAEGGNAFYAVRWAALPNLAADLVVPPLTRVMPLELAGRLFLVLIFALLAGGALWLNRIFAGRWRLWPLLAFFLVYNRLFLWGFINYLFGLGLAFCGVALWLASERARARLRVLASALVAALCFFSHIAAFGVYALMIAGVEATPGFAELRAGEGRALARRVALAGAQFVLPIAVFFAAWRPVAGGPVSYAGFARKADLLFSVFDNYSRPFDIASFALFLGLLAILFWRGGLRLAPRPAGAIGFLLAAYLALPSQLLSGSGADRRLPTALFLLLVASLTPCFERRRIAVVIAGAAAALLVARLAVIEAVWRHADRIYAADLAAIDALPFGARLAVGFPAGAAHAGGIPQLHVATLAAWRREAFVPTIFAVAAQQPLRLKPGYAALAAALPPATVWSAFVAGDAAARLRAAATLADYDYLALAAGRPFAVRADRCLRPLAGQPSFQIFALDHDGGCAER